MKYFALTVFCLMSFFMNGQSISVFQGPKPDFKTSGFLVEEIHDQDKKFYIQNIEDGTALELLFYFDLNKDLSFDEFHFVEISGNYIAEKNLIYVDSMHPAGEIECTETIHIAIID